MNWDIAGFILSAAMTVGAVIMLWFKVSRDSAANRQELANQKAKAAEDKAAINKQIEEHGEKIAIILVDKANCADLVKLATLVSSIEDMMIAHHTDSMAHRNTDFEKRIDTLTKSIDGLASENRLDHQAIKAKIGIA